MARIKIELPEHFSFVTDIPVRITDLNYGGHVGNDSILSLLHEARAQFLKSRGYNELNFAGTSLIMSDVAIEFKNELYYGDKIKASLVIGELTRIGFDLYYKLEKNENGTDVVVAIAKTGMNFYNYQLKKIIRLPEEVKKNLSL